jgi:hypothetical protein
VTADPLPDAARVRKARRSSAVACGHYVLTGQVIVKRGGRWICLPCALDAIHCHDALAGSFNAAIPPPSAPAGIKTRTEGKTS